MGRQTMRQRVAEIVHSAGRPMTTPEIVRAIHGRAEPGKSKYAWVYQGCMQAVRYGDLDTWKPAGGWYDPYVSEGRLPRIFAMPGTAVDEGYEIDDNPAHFDRRNREEHLARAQTLRVILRQECKAVANGKKMDDLLRLADLLTHHEKKARTGRRTRSAREVRRKKAGRAS